MSRIQNAVISSRVSASQVLASIAGLAIAAAGASAQITVLFNGSVSTNYSVPSNWNGGVVPTNSGGNFYMPFIGVGLTTDLLAGSVQVDAATLAANSLLRLSPNTAFRVRGATSNVSAGNIFIMAGAQLELNQAGPGTCDLIIEGSGPLILAPGGPASGRVIMTASAGNRIFSANGSNTLQNEIIIEGGGQVGVGQTQIDNRGIIRATLGTTLFLQPGGGGTTSRGILEADGGTFVARNATTNITVASLTGTVRAINSGIFQLEGSILGGLLQTTGATSVIRSLGGTIVNATFDNAFVEVPASNQLRIGGTLLGTLASEIRLQQAGPGNSDLIVTGSNTTTVSGPQIVMTPSINNRIYSETGAATFALAGGSTIRGGGQIGLAQTTLTFAAGTNVAADNASLVVHAGVGTDNNGTLEARNAGTLFLRGGIDNAGGFVDAQAGSIVDLDGCILSGGTLRSFGSGFLLANANTPLLQNFTLSQGELRIAPQSQARTGGTISINGSLTLNQSGAGDSDLIVIGNGITTFNGTGEIRTSTSTSNRIYSETGGGTITLNLPLRGASQLGLGQTTMVLNSIVENDGGGTLFIQPGTGFDNNGIIRQSGSGLTALRGNFSNEQGRLEVTGTGNLDLDACNLSGGILADTGAGSFVADANTPTIQNITIESGSLVIGPSGTARFGGVNTIAGNVLLNQSGAGVSDLIAIGNGITTFNGTGEIRTSTSTSNRIYSETGGGTITLNLPLRGASQLGLGFTTLVLNSLVDNDTSGSLTIQPGGGGTDNNGTIRQSGTGLTQIRNLVTNQQGRLEVTGTGNVDLDGCTLVGGVLADTGAGSFVVDANVPILQDITLASGDLILTPVSQTRFSGTSTIAGTVQLAQAGAGNCDIVVQGNLTLNGPGNLTTTNTTANRIYSDTGAGSITFGPALTVRGSAQLGLGQTAITNRGLILSDLSAGIAIGTNGTGFTNEGEIRVTGAGGINAFAGAFTHANGSIQIDAGTLFNRSAGTFVQSGGTIVADGELQVVSDNFQLQNGTLRGDGLVDSILTQTGGTIDPTPSLTIEGGLTQNATSTLRIDLDGTGPNDADILSVTGPAALNGTLRVVIGTNYIITPGDQFVILSSTAARTGTFSSLIVEPTQLGVDASVQYLNNSVVLTIDGCVICGYCNYDYNRDENVDLLDAQQMAQVFVGIIQPEANWLDGDLNLDENADLTDAQLLARAIVQGLCEL